MAAEIEKKDTIIRHVKSQIAQIKTPQKSRNACIAAAKYLFVNKPSVSKDFFHNIRHISFTIVIIKYYITYEKPWILSQTPP